ncbi:selenocysteine-specific translation elongation factor [Thalassobacillus devorans]|uniref:selenocysteine-specific translation elongation factor n=1 Tax=Thalassobacillus devorans TaxID=279813 RepID=UPI00068508B6|nr:selenocysteine-specific translation elongation factor [Thalassobacillus devorans]
MLISEQLSGLYYRLNDTFAMQACFFLWIATQVKEKRDIMLKRYYTIGMAGHIDHGKTALTKALTEVDTDRLKEEKSRNISIEPGFAPLKLQNLALNVSIIDVPGHEKFIRQMIAGVAGIDLVIIVVAGDEGIMPQTREHMDILSFLGVEEAILVVTKADLIDKQMKELVAEDIRSYINGKSYQHSELLFIDSLSGKGISELEQLIEKKVAVQPYRDTAGSFRMPIDQSFTIKGQGTVVRGTIYEGSLMADDPITILPEHKKARIRQIQVHHVPVEQAFAGQRAAVNISGIGKEDVKRGDVMVKNDAFLVTRTLDVRMKLVDELRYTIKQRTPINVYIGTAEAAGRLVFFDRNEVTEDTEEIFCQLRLDEPIVAKRGDRFILRRPTPVETIGGGVVIDPNAGKHKFSHETIEMLKEKSRTTPSELLENLLQTYKWMNIQQLLKETSMDTAQLENLLASEIDAKRIRNVNKGFILVSESERMLKDVMERLKEYHQLYPLRAGKNKPEVVTQLPVKKSVGSPLLDAWIESGELKATGPFVALPEFSPYIPEKWSKRMNLLKSDWITDGLQVKEWSDYGAEHGIPAEWMKELRMFFLQQNAAWEINDNLIVHINPIRDHFQRLYEMTGDEFSLKEAKESFQVSRKYLVPLLEKSDDYGMTIRAESVRKWLKQPEVYFNSVHEQEAD